MAFSNIENSEKLKIIDIAIINNKDFEENQVLKRAFEELSKEENEDRLFNIKYVNEEEAKDLLNNDKISGYLRIQENNPKIVVKQSGINETILKYVTEEITQNTNIVKDLSVKKIIDQKLLGNTNVDYEKIYKDILENLEKDVNLKNISDDNLSYTMIEFYTLIAMSCLYGGILGMVAINQNLANMSNKGKRISVGPVNKLKIIFSSVLASYVVQLVGLAILFLYTVFVLKVDYGNNLPLIILLGMTGSIAGLSMGLMIGSCIKTNENAKTGILISVTMLGCFLSGMMGITMKYVIDTNVPIINKINPASMITDGFYSLYYYDTLNRYFFNISSLLIFSAIMILLSFISLRRQKYDSI
ncbi:MAG: ABC transporter permease [Clostridia bacterium]|nr:ABC transporter permease [Clostridia bacterium]